MPNFQSFGEDRVGDAPAPRLDGSLPLTISTRIGSLDPAYGTVGFLDEDIFDIGRLQGGSATTFRLRPLEWDASAFEQGLDTAEIKILAGDGTEVASSNRLYLPTDVTFTAPVSGDYYLLLEGSIGSSGQYSINMDYAGAAPSPAPDPPPGGQVDTTAPELTSIDFPDSVDISGGAGEVSFSISAKDDTGIDDAVIWLDRDVGFEIGSYGFVGLYSGWAGGESNVDRTIIPGTAPGVVNVERVEITDRLGNETIVRAAELESQGWQTSFRITDADAGTAPSIIWFIAHR